MNEAVRPRATDLIEQHRRAGDVDEHRPAALQFFAPASARERERLVD